MKVKRERFEKISYVVGHHKNNCVHMLVMIKIKWACKGFDWLASKCVGRAPVVTVREFNGGNYYPATTTLFMSTLAVRLLSSSAPPNTWFAPRSLENLGD